MSSMHTFMTGTRCLPSTAVKLMFFPPSNGAIYFQRYLKAFSHTHKVSLNRQSGNTTFQQLKVAKYFMVMLLINCSMNAYCAQV